MRTDPAVDVVTGFIARDNVANVNITLKPLNVRKVGAFQIANRLRPKLARVPGATLFLQPVQEVQVGGRPGNAQFQYTLQGDNLQDLLHWSPIVQQKLARHAAASGREHRFAESRLASRPGDRPRYGFAPGHFGADHR